MTASPSSRLGSGRRRTHALRIAGLAISVVAIVIVLQSMDLAAAARILGQADVFTLLVVLGFLVIQFVLRAFRWSVLLPRRHDGSPVPVLRVIPPLLAGYLGNAVLPARLGEPIRAALVARRERLDSLECFGTTIVERVIDTATLAIVAFVAAVFVGAEPWILFVTGVAALAGSLLIVLLATVGLTVVVEFLGRLFRHGPTLRRAASIGAWMRSFAQGIDRGRAPRRLLIVIAISCICWGIDATAFWLVAGALDVQMTFAAAVLVAAVTVLGTAIPSAPGYVGTFELAATTTAVALGVPAPAALAVAILAHIVTVVPVAIAGAAATVLMGTGLTHLSEEAAPLAADHSTDGSPTAAEMTPESPGGTMP